MSPESAITRGLGQKVDEWGSPKDHSNLAKFTSRDDSIFVSLKTKFGELVRKAPRDRRRLRTLLNFPDPTSSAPFVGRGTIIESLKAYLTAEDDVDEGEEGDETEGYRRLAVLHGNGGMGKTRIALKYSLRNKWAYDRIIWIRANSEQQIRGSFRAVAQQLNLPSPEEDAIAQVLSKLLCVDGRVLIVYDSLDNGHLLDWIRREHSPRWRRPLEVIITTRDRRYLDLRPQRGFFIGPMSPEEGQDFLEKTLEKPKQDADGRNRGLVELGEELGWHPLALWQAASYLKTSPVPVRAYLRMLRDRPLETLRERHPWNDEENSTAIAVFETSMARVQQVSKYAEKWLTFCSYLGCQVDMGLFHVAFQSCSSIGSDATHAPGAETRQRLEWLFQDGEGSRTPLPVHRLSDLGTLNLIDGSRSDCWEMHPLVATWARHRQDTHMRRELIVTAVCFIHACAEHFRRRPQGVTAIGAVWRRDTLTAYYAQLPLARHVASCVEFCDSLLSRSIGAEAPVECTVSLAALCVHMGHLAAAERMLKAALETRPEASESAVIEARRTISWALRKADPNRYAEALQYQLAAVAQLKAAARPSDVAELLRAQGELATIYRDLQDYDRAIELQSKVVEEAKEVYRNLPSGLLHEMSCLATIYWKKGDAERSLAMDEEALRLCERAYPGGPERYKKMQQVACSLYNLGRYEDARDKELEALTGLQGLHGDNHLETAEAKYNLSKTLWISGIDVAQALELAEDTLRVCRHMLGDKHKRTEKAKVLVNRIGSTLTSRHIAKIK